ncbi:MAG: MBL fold metallo-hydrolase [Alphaproteobacteria bacterium]|nr:MBL fold metallo-hydrolase [Alphaproteobacteria bacterium]
MSSLFQDNEFYFVPLAGSEEFGTNFNLYVCDDQYLLIDCGIGFADERFPGIDLLLPDPSFVSRHKEKIAGMIITHAHEDHIGAVAYLWDQLECPIYATKFTAAVLKRKLEQENVRDVPIHIISTGAQVEIGSFKTTFIPVSHSVPDSCSILIETKHGNILHSGDWNLDPNPILGEKTDEKTFKAIGKKNILAYIGDSTNAQVNGFAGSETEVAKGLAREFRNCKGKIAITMFASNIGRLISIARAAKEVGRSVALVGRSLHRMVGAAIDCGYMKDIPDFVTEDDIPHIPDENLVLIVTGSQGEHRAALARISRGDHRSISLNRGDTVIFSSRAIPGNERTINTVKNNLSAAGVSIITPRDTTNTIHISGHPCRDEIAAMLQWVRPKCVIPVHGERQQLDAHADFAKTCQVNHVVVPNNGSVIRLAPGEPTIIDHVETALLAVDQKRLIPTTHQSITARRKLQYSGTVHASLVLDQDLCLLGKPKITTVGLSCMRSDDCVIEDLEEYVLDTLDDIDLDPPYNEDDVAEQIRIPLRRYVQDILGLQPKTTVHVTILDR